MDWHFYEPHMTRIHQSAILSRLRERIPDGCIEDKRTLRPMNRV
jgi:hypothetical protein